MISVEYLASKLAKAASEQEERWLEYNIRKRFPGIYSLVMSYQPQAALRMMKAFGLHVAIFPSGDRELRMNKEIISRLEKIVWYDGQRICSRMEPQ